MTWKGITVGWGFRNPVSSDDSINKGSSSFDDYWFGYSFDAVRVDVFYANFKGFYLDEGDGNTSPKKFLAPDLRAQTYGADVSWVLNSDEFSLRTAINMTERPKASGGSWIVGASFVDTSFNDDVDFFPASTLSQMGSDATLRSAHFQSLSIKGGYGYTWKFGEKWMLSLAGQGGWGGQKSTVGLVSDSYSQTQVNFKYDAWISGGWHGDDWFSGAKIMIDGTHFHTRELTVVSQLMEAKVFVGHAF